MAVFTLCCMKSPFVIVVNLLFLLFISVDVKSQQINWIKADDSNIDKVLYIASSQKKKTCCFLHLDWSKQSQFLDKRIMPESEVVDYLSQHFINVRINVGKGNGNKFLSRYRIGGLPALVFFDEHGNLIRVANKGLYSIKAVLKAARLTVGEPNEKEWAYYREQYQRGRRDWQFLAQYIEERNIETGLPAPYRLVEEFVVALPHQERLRNKRVRFMIYFNARPTNSIYHILKTDRVNFIELQDVAMSLDIFGQMLDHIHMKEPWRLDRVKKEMRNDFGEICHPALEYYELVNLLNSSKYAAYIDDYFAFIRRFNLEPDYYSEIVALVLKTDDIEEKHLQALIDYFHKRACDEPGNLFDHAILTALLIKANHIEEGVIYAQHIVSELHLYPVDKFDDRCLSYLKKVAKGHRNANIFPLLDQVW